MIVSDVHGNEMDVDAVSAALKFADMFDPDIRVINGDLFDFAALRQGAKDTRSEKGRCLTLDLDSGLWFIDSFFKKGKENHFNLGNHDQRLWDLMTETQDGFVRTASRAIVDDIIERLNKMGASWNPYHARDGVYKIGNLNVVHGYSCGMSASREHVNAYGNCVFGHTHAITSQRGKSSKEHIAYNQGCLCKVDMAYANKKLGSLMWQHGWGYGLVFEDGTFSYFQAVGINGEFVVATELERINYERLDEITW